MVYENWQNSYFNGDNKESHECLAWADRPPQSPPCRRSWWFLKPQAKSQISGGESVRLEEMSRSTPSPAPEVDGTVRISLENSIARWRGLPVAISLDSGSHRTNQGHRSDCLAELLRLESFFAGEDSRLADKREGEEGAVARRLSRPEGEKEEKEKKRKKERKKNLGVSRPFRSDSNQFGLIQCFDSIFA
ncbi:hypothetical protein JCGZ_01464 [Jatropha curcas]|uniref:Uncharacterized protein n=1 Tax=Jatropha curcas TaxID=180498 RepID=A0A067LKU1_JATCU|nr:hypothetical protein JCGZ_01464 [Jatropha curcas]